MWKGTRWCSIPGARPPIRHPAAAGASAAGRAGRLCAGGARAPVARAIAARAFSHCTKAKVVALVSGTPEKLKTVARQYGIDPAACYSYEEFDRIKDNAAIKAVYIVLPNGMHREYTERAAAAGKHVLCEKPMSVNSAEARKMVEACEKASVKLMIAYRIQYEGYNLRLAEFVRGQRFGRLVGMSSPMCRRSPKMARNNGVTRRPCPRRRLAGYRPLLPQHRAFPDRRRAGGNQRQSLQPTGDPRFAEVEETVSFTLRFPSNVMVNCLTSYGARDDKHQRLNFATALPICRMPTAMRASPSSSPAARAMPRRRRSCGCRCRTSLPPEIDHMATCILEDRRPRTPGEEGMQDHVLMEAIYQAAETGQTGPPRENRQNRRFPRSTGNG